MSPGLLSRIWVFTFFCVAGLWTVTTSAAADRTSGPRIESLVNAVNGVGDQGIGHDAAMTQMRSWLGDDSPAVERLFATLDAMGQANPRGKNWMRMIVSDLRNRIDGDDALRDRLRVFFDDRSRDPDARYWVYRELVNLAGPDESVQADLLDRSTDDPSLPLRFLAIQKVIDETDTVIVDQGDDDIRADVTGRLAAALPLARNPEQLKQITAALAGLGQDVDLSTQLAMVTSWWIAAPFDNTGGGGFDAIYEIEQAMIENPLVAPEPERILVGGKKAVTWQKHSTDESMGLLDLNPIYDGEKEAVAYAFCLLDITADELTDDRFEARLGSINANKVWVNGTLVMSNEIYHSGNSIDQYVRTCPLRPGVNSVLLKICQNDQTQPWAQDWQFQFRLTDSTGRGIAFQMVSPELEP